MEGPKVSIIIPAYNAAPYIKQCLESVRRQTLADIEIICVDDGSTDDTPEIIREVSARDPRISLIRQENLYAGAARNAGMKACRGEYMLFWDADDFFDPEAACLMYEKAEADGADICICNARQYIDGEGYFRYRAGYLQKTFIPDEIPWNIRTAPHYIFNISSNVPWNKMFRRAFIEETGLKFEAIPKANDQYFVMLAMAKAARITCVDKVLVTYRVGSASNLTGRQSPMWLAGALTRAKSALEGELSDYLVNQSFVTRALDALLYQFDNLTDLEAREAFFRRVKEELLGALGIKDYGPDYYRRYTGAYKKLLTLLESGSAAEFYEKVAPETEKKEGSATGAETKKGPAAHPDIASRAKGSCLPAAGGGVSPAPKVSIIIPIYNAEKTLGEALESVRAQTLQDIEIICVNSGATDTSAVILNEHAKADPRIKVIDKENEGKGSALNAGLFAAAGEYVAFLMPTAAALPGMCEVLYNAATRAEAKTAATRVETASSEGQGAGCAGGGVSAPSFDFVKSDFYKQKSNNEREHVRLSSRDDIYNREINPSIMTYATRTRRDLSPGLYKKSFLEARKIKFTDGPSALFPEIGFFWQVFALAESAVLKDVATCALREEKIAIRAEESVFCVNDEYEKVREILEENGLFDRFKFHFNEKRFNNYKFALNCMAPAFKERFVRRASEEFRSALEAGELDKKVFSAENWDELTFLIEDPDDYYRKAALLGASPDIYRRLEKETNEKERLERSLAKEKEKLAEKNSELAKEKEKLEKARADLNKIKASKAYRFGNLLLKGPRYLKSLKIK